ncbi:MAG TPA: pyridoxal-phosphate dependent enzyme [Thermoanaerobaculia bacterium]|nr:pyridoxal-phosphate dependent enzyme [Thermoanaerobaculia bacterium]
MNDSLNDVTLEAIEQARSRIASYARRTPLLHSQVLSERLRVPVHLKAENLQTTGSFKIRGAANALELLSPERRTRGVVTSSTGNHALALAYVARRLGIALTVCLPPGLAVSKLSTLRDLGATLHLCSSMAETERVCEQLREACGLAIIHPFDDPHVIAGQGTLALDVVDDCPDVRTILVPVSGGGLASGMVLALAGWAPWARMVGVYPSQAPALAESLRQGQPVLLKDRPTLAQALAGGINPDNRYTLKILRAHSSAIVEVSEAEIAAAIRFAYLEHRLVLEGGGAVALAAVLSGRISLRFRTGPIVIVLSGGNTDLASLDRVLAAETKACDVSARPL